MRSTRLAIRSLALTAVAAASGARAHSHSEDEHAEGAGSNYAAQHMASEHHIGGFDLASFFHLHDLDHDGILSPSEIEAIYGLHHYESTGNSKTDAAHNEKVQIVLDKVLEILDRNKDGVLTLSEFEEGGEDGLPSFPEFGGLGHHYDEESEYFIHHEEQFHNTPETQTDESYNHPEDIKHFAHHDHIESDEDERERLYLQGEAIDADFQSAPEQMPAAEGGGELPEVPNEIPEEEQAKHGGEPIAEEGEGQQQVPLEETQPPKGGDNLGALRRAAAQAARHWGEGDAGYARPRDGMDKASRRGLPYKYRFSRSYSREL